MAHYQVVVGGTEYDIRKKLIENGLVEAIVVLPRKMFYTTDISVTLWIINKNKKARSVERNGEKIKYRNREREVLFLDLREKGIAFEKKFTQLTENDILEVAKTLHNWQSSDFNDTYENVPEYSYSASLEELKKKDYSLVPSKYIEFINRDENINFEEKMKSLQSEFSELLEKEEQSKKDLLNVFKELGYEISKRVFEREYRKSGIPFYRAGEVRMKKEGKPLSDLLFISESRYYEIVEKFGQPLPNDILLTAVGSLLGDSYLVENEKFYFKDGNVIWFKNFKILNSNFLIYSFLQSKAFLKFLDEIKIGSGQSAITIKGLGEKNIILPVSNRLVLY